MTDLEALSLVIYGESRGEVIEGKLGVAAAIRNRVLEEYRGAKSYLEVCTAHAQFSAWTEEAASMADAKARMESSSRHIDDPTLDLCQQIAAATIAGTLPDCTKGATHYITTELYHRAPPSWARNATPLCTLGNQTFFHVS
jgi:spore germination cell wall hydrolase CwlJ-like protein